MRKLWQLLAVVVVGASLGVAVVGCDSSPSMNKDKTGGDKMGREMGGEKMGGDTMRGETMSGDKMGGDTMGGDKKMQGDKGGK
jgi:pentapeptide MXKDX repeat protein